MGSHSLLQGIFLTQGPNLGLPHCRQTLYRLSHREAPTLRGEVIEVTKSKETIFLPIEPALPPTGWATNRSLLLQLYLWFFNSIFSSIPLISLACACVQSCLSLCEPMNCSLPGSSVHGIFQARGLEQLVVSYSRGLSQPKEQTDISCVSCVGRQILYH